jgi:acyl carrier protein
MGLDVVQLGYSVEKTFRVRIDWGEVSGDGREPTAGDLFAHVLERVGRDDEHRLGDAVLRRLRATLTELFHEHAGVVGPDTPLEAVVPLPGRRQNWRLLSQTLDLPLPPLRRPPWMERFVAFPWALLALLLPFIPFLLGIMVQNPTARWLLVALVAGAALRSGLLHFLTLPFAVRFPPDCDTVGELVEVLLRENYGLLAERERVWHRDEAWRILREVVATTLNVEPDQVTPAARLVSDLGAN